MKGAFAVLVLSTALANRYRDDDDVMVLETDGADNLQHSIHNFSFSWCPDCKHGYALPSSGLQVSVRSHEQRSKRMMHSTRGKIRRAVARRKKHKTKEHPDEDKETEEKKDCTGLSNGLTANARVWLQTGWLLLFISFIVLFVLYLEVVEALVPPSEQWEQEPAQGGIVARVMKELQGMGPSSSLINATIISLGALNFYTYAVETESKIHELQGGYVFLGLPIDHSRQTVELLGIVFFSIITATRLAVVHTHPEWRRFGYTAAARYLIGNLYMVLEVFGLTVTLFWHVQSDGYMHNDHVNLLWLFLFRAIEMLERGGAGLGIRRLKHVVTDDGKLLLVASIIGLVIWLVMSGLYFVANRHNCTSLWEDAGDWQRFQSIPSSMWYVLINLLKEHPLADAHESPFQRLLVCAVCILAMPIFALPTSIFQYSLLKQAEEDEEDEKEEMMRQLAAQSLEQTGRPQTRRDSRRANALQTQEIQDALMDTPRQGLITLFLSLFSIFAYFYYTARDTDHATIFVKVPVIVSPTTLAIVDGVVGICFLFEFASRLSAGGGSYLGSTFGLIDLIAWLPGVLHVLIYQSLSGPQHELLCAACVLRIFKLERYLHSFRDMLFILRDNSAVLTATFVVSMLMWLSFSTLLYLTEKHNPEDEMAEVVYGSVMRSLWAEIINLHGEWPWADYTPVGKAIGTIIGLFSIMLFCIPISIFGEGFQELIEDDRSILKDDDTDLSAWQQHCRPEEPGIRQQVYDWFYADLHCQEDLLPAVFRALRALSIMLVAATTVTTAMSTVESSDARDASTTLGQIFLVVDGVATVWFVLEFLLRTVATGWRHACSFTGLCDLISLVVFAYTLNPVVRQGNEKISSAFRPDFADDAFTEDCWVLLRLLRLFSLESYFYAAHTLKCVFYLNAWPLARSGCALVCTWFTHATLMYLCENPKALGMIGESKDEGEDDMTMVQRYRSMWTALQYSIVHLFGDYPETDYSLPAKVVHFVGIMGGIAIISCFCGVFSAAFINFLEKQRSHQARARALRSFLAVIQIKISLRRALIVRRARRELAGRSHIERAVSTAQPLRRFSRAVILGHTRFGRAVRFIFNGAVVVALLNSLAASVPEVDEIKAAELASISIEMVCTLVFLADYAMRVMARPWTLLSFWGVLDLICCLPGVLILDALRRGTYIGKESRHEALVEAFSMLRAIRILNFPCFHRETVIISRVLSNASGKLGLPAYLAVNVWITTSALFMWVENEWKDESELCVALTNKRFECGSEGTHEDMSDVPSAMYWCSIFLTGEWANVDFTFYGSRICILYVIFGIAMFSIPVGILVEAVQGTLKVEALQDKKTKRMLSKDLGSSSKLPSVSIGNAPTHWGVIPG